MTTVEEFERRLRNFPEIVNNQLHTSMARSLLWLEQDARTYAPRDTGHLGGSINGPERITGSGLSIEGRVGPSVAYGAPVEMGRRVGAKAPPVEALIPWVQRHWRVPLVGDRPRVQRGQMVLPLFEQEVGYRATNLRRPPRNVTMQQIRRRAFALARAIQLRGIRRQPYLQQSWGKKQGRITNEFRQMGTRVAASLSTGQSL